MLKYLLLGLLAKGPAHGYELRSAIQQMFGGTWELNIGQVYTTLDRLERDGLVSSERVAQSAYPDRRMCSITDQGYDALLEWLPLPVRAINLKQDLFAKVVLHAVLDAGDPVVFIRLQRQRCLESLAELQTRRIEQADDPTTTLLLDGTAFHLEADLRWLEECESRLGDLKGAQR